MAQRMLVVRSSETDKPVRSFKWAENAVRFMFVESCFNNQTLVLTHRRLGLEIAIVKATTSGINVAITNPVLYACFKRKA